MKRCYLCERDFVEEVKDIDKECICHKWLCSELCENLKDVQKIKALRFMCKDCYSEQKRSNRLRDRTKRELTPSKKETKRKEKR